MQPGFKNERLNKKLMMVIMVSLQAEDFEMILILFF